MSTPRVLGANEAQESCTQNPLPPSACPLHDAEDEAPGTRSLVGAPRPTPSGPSLLHGLVTLSLDCSPGLLPLNLHLFDSLSTVIQSPNRVLPT